MTFNPIVTITALLSLCGIASLRSFLPTFLFLVLARTLPGCGHCPELVSKLIESIPAPLMTDGALALFGLLALVELFANWNDTLREMLEDSNWDLYFKPAYAFLFALMVGAPEYAPAIDASGLQTVLPEISSGSTSAAAPSTAVLAKDWAVNAVQATAAGAGTAVLANFRGSVAGFLRTLDPDNSLHLHTLATSAEEATWLAVLLVFLAFPILAALLVVVLAVLGLLFRSFLRSYEKRHTHACPTCGKPVHDAALLCASCHTEQPHPIHAVGAFGIAKTATINVDTLNERLEHHRRFLFVHRCPLCGSPLKGNDGICPACSAQLWGQGYTRGDLIKSLDRRVLVALIVGIAFSWVPVLGFVLAVVLLKFGALNVLRAYEGFGRRILGNLILRIAKWTLLLLAFVCSSIPFVGTILLIPYLLVYLSKRRHFLSSVTSQ